DVERGEHKPHIPCLVGFSDEYAALSSSALNAFLSFIGQFEIDILCLQNPPMQIRAQFQNLHSRVKEIEYPYARLDLDILKEIYNGYSRKIIGQERALLSILTALYPLAAQKRDKPAVLLFYGPTGVGKSETAKYLSGVMGQPLFRRQFSMFHSGEFATYLFGARHTENSLAKELMERESEIILFDEFDKPSPIFHSAFYQLFDEGIYEDKNYRANARGAVIICTSNYMSAEEAREKLGAPLFARFDAAISFNNLSNAALDKILRIKCESECSALSESERSLVSAEVLYDQLRENLSGTDGARGVEHQVRAALSLRLLESALN
ncbi:MAG: AAA family ATPase, partial [Cloacibacillus sp.]